MIKLGFVLGLLWIGHLGASVSETIIKVQARAIASRSDALVVLRHGRPILNYRTSSCSHIDAQEMIKPLIGMAIAMLLDDKSLPCLDIALHTYYPEWNCIGYRQITLRHLLGNMAGLDSQSLLPCGGNPSAVLRTPLLFTPGTSYSTNTRNLLLLIDLVKRCSGKEFFDYLDQRLFRPLGIVNISWRSNCSKTQLPQLMIDAMDLAKIGLLISYDGKWEGKELIGQRWLREMLLPCQNFTPFLGWQWWLDFYDIEVWWEETLLAEYRRSGIRSDLIEPLEKLQGRVLHFSGQVYGQKIVKLRGSDLANSLGGEFLATLLTETDRLGLPMGRFRVGKLKMASAHGRGGQHLIIMPQQGLVAVRQRSELKDSNLDEYDDLPDLLEEIAQVCDCYGDG